MKKTAVITGASGGIGLAIAEEFANAGYNVLINYNKNKNAALSLEQHLACCGKSAMAYKADVSKENEARGLIAAAIDRFGSVDVLVNNAGISHVGLITETTLQKWNEVFAVNMAGTFLVTNAALPYMISKKQGRIINISSVWGLVGASCEVAYSASKAAVIGYTKALAKEVGPSNICVNCIAPGVIDTKMNSNLTPDELEELRQETPIMKIGAPADVARLALYLASEAGDFITGQTISLNGGFEYM